MARTAVLVGARSEVARETAILLAQSYDQLVLACRDSQSLLPFQSHLHTVSNCQATLVELDILDVEAIDSLASKFNDVSLVITVFGYLGEQEKAMSDPVEAAEIIDVNYRNAVLLLNRFAENMRHNGSGTIVGISSVAGERGRASNFVYGSAKAGFTAYLSGLRNALFKSGVHVMTVKPGFMATRMTEHLTLPASLTATPLQAAQAIVRGVERKKNVVYVLRRWALIMFVIRIIPEFVFKRLNL